MFTALLVIGILVFLIVVHELGHFVAAKFFGLRVEEFGVGYPPRALFIGKWGGTEYTLNWILFGGFVRIFGDDGTQGSTHADPSRFSNASKKAQATVLVAGVLMNTLAAWFLITGALTLGIPRPATDGDTSAHLMIANTIARSPAEVAGLRAGDIIIALEFGDLRIDSDLTPSAMAEFVQTRGGENITVFYERGVEAGEVIVQPAHAVISEESGRVAIGVELALITDSALGFFAATKEGAYRTLGMFKAVGQGFWSVVFGALQGDPAWRELVGPVGIVGVVSQASTQGAGYVLLLTAFISVNLAIINLIPIPALYVGRLSILGYEAVRGRRISHLAMRIFSMIGVVIIALLIITVTYQDIVRLIG